MSRIDTASTPCYYYDMDLLRRTLDAVEECTAGTPVRMHYAVKANCQPEIMRVIAARGFGVDCVSGNEIAAALECGFDPEKIYYAGVGKTDGEIKAGIEAGIGCFNIESLEEIDIISRIAADMRRKVTVALRVNPDIDAHTHEYITTGLKENKFGIDMSLLDEAVAKVADAPALVLGGLHFHIGSQILDMGDFIALCNRVNELQDRLEARQIFVKHINVGGGLGIDYDHPNRQSIPDFKSYFSTYAGQLKLRPHQTLHFELGRAVVGQCGTLISKVLYVKQGVNKKFAILDAGMTDLIRPALYQAHHKMENLTSDETMQTYDVVGPICESSDVFGKAIDLNKVKRGDLIALRSAGAYGEIMASGYNCRELPKGYLSDEFV